MKNMISDKKTVPVPGRGKKDDGEKNLRRKKVIVPLICIMLAAVSPCIAGVTVAPVEAEGTALQANGQTILKKAAEDISEEVTTKEVLNDAVSKSDSKAVIAKKFLEKDESREQQHENEKPKIPSQQEHQQEEENESVEANEETGIIEETEEENEALEKAEILESAESAEEEGAVGKEQEMKEEKEPHKNPEQQDELVENNGDAGNDLLQTPVEGFFVSSPFGHRWGRLHTGIDLALAQGNSIYAADGGTVIFSGYGGGYGNMVKIDHGNGMQTNYAHCSQLLVSQGQQVERGETIALVGSTGNSTGPHLHFEVVIDGRCVDPASYLSLE